MSKSFVIISVLACIVAYSCIEQVSLAYAGFEEGAAAYDKGDLALALKEFKESAEQGDSDSQYNLGAMYLNGQGVEKNDLEALKWFQKAADQGDDEAQFRVGWMYANGTAVSKDCILAYMWASLSATKGCGWASMLRENLKKEMSPEQIAEAQRLVREWKCPQK